MPDSKTVPGPSCAELLERVEHLAPTIRDHAPAAEADRCLSDVVVKAMVDADLAALSRPAAHGGAELDPVSTFRVFEAISRHDSAVGWNFANSVAHVNFLAWLSDEGAAEVLDTPNLLTAGSFNPPGAAHAVEGGYRVGGSWRFASNCRHANWYFFRALAMDGDQPRLGSDGNPQQLFVWIPAEQATIVDTWHTLGMRGTGSNDVEVHDAFVPAARVAAVAPLERPGSAFAGPLYRLAIWTGEGLIASTALGIARAAVDDFVALAGSKTPSFTASALCDRHVVQRQVAEAQAHLGAGRAYLHETFATTWQLAEGGAPIDLGSKLSMQLAVTHAVSCAAKAVDLVCEAAGSSSIRDELPFGRYFRDVHTISRHAFASTQRYESVGALMLGTESDWGFFGL